MQPDLARETVANLAPAMLAALLKTFFSKTTFARTSTPRISPAWGLASNQRKVCSFHHPHPPSHPIPPTPCSVYPPTGQGSPLGPWAHGAHGPHRAAEPMEPGGPRGPHGAHEPRGPNGCWARRLCTTVLEVRPLSQDLKTKLANRMGSPFSGSSNHGACFARVL
jgi:hypothetical protein